MTPLITRYAPIPRNSHTISICQFPSSHRRHDASTASDLFGRSTVTEIGTRMPTEPMITYRVMATTRDVGLRVLRMISFPTAAAITYGGRNMPSANVARDDIVSKRFIHPGVDG